MLAGLPHSPTSEYVVFARFFGNRCARVPCFTITRHTCRLQLPSPPLQTRVNKFHCRISHVLAAASALVVSGRYRLPAHVMQRPELLGTMLSQRWRVRASVKDRAYLGYERLQLLCCGCPLSALLLRLATVVDRSGRPSIQCMHVVCIMKRYLSDVARRLWNECLQ